MGRDRREKDRDDSRGKDRDRRDSRSDDRDRDRRKDRDSKDSRDRRDRDKEDKREPRKKDRDDKEEGDEDMPSIASEVSLSVEATNALRISLGLKPLHIPDPKEAEEKEQARLKAVEEKQKTEKSAAIKQKLVDMRSDRQHQTFVGTKSIADEIDDEDASAWLSKAKTIQSDEMEREKQKAAKRRREMEELEAQYTSSDLTGLKISHAMSEFENGDPVILTLADTSILNKEGGINEDDDELENVNIAEKQRRAKAEKDAKAPKKYDEQFDGDPMLHHYDKQDETKKLYIGETGNVTQHAEEVKKKLAILEDADQMSLDGEKKIASEYFTKAEMAKFKKPSKKKRKTRNQSTLDEISQEVENASATSSDHGSRTDGGNKLKRDVAKEIASQTKKSKGYQAALTKGAAESKILFDDKEDADLIGTDRRDLSAKRKMEAQMQNERLEEKIRQRKAKEEKLDLSNIGGDAGLTFTPTTEFIRLVQPVTMEEVMDKPIRKKRDALDAKIEAQVEADADEYEKSMRNQAKKEKVNKPTIKEENDMDIDDDKPPALVSVKSDPDHVADDDESDDQTGLEKVMEEPTVATGIYATLAFLREKGSQEAKLETMAGRKNDLQVDYSLAAHDPAPGLRLDYIDEFGRQMTPKEAFRVLSHKFHGKMPGKNKQDKRLKAHLEQQRMLKMSSTDTPLGTAKILRQETERTQLPYVVLSGGVSVNRDTSEPAVLIQDNLSNVEIKKTRRDAQEDLPVPEVKPANVLQGEFSGFKLAIGKKK